MTAEADIHAALMARVETITDYPILWPQKGGDKPAGEHISVFHVPNDNARLFLDAGPMQRKGFLVITLVSPLGGYEVVTKRKAGEIAAYFPLNDRLTSNDTTITIFSHTVKPGREVSDRWETPIWIAYEGYA